MPNSVADFFRSYPAKSVSVIPLSVCVYVYVLLVYIAEHSLDAAATFEKKAEGADFKAGKQSSPEVTDSKQDLESPRADHLRDADNDNFEKGDHKIEEEEAASEDRQLSNSPASSY